MPAFGRAEDRAGRRTKNEASLHAYSMQGSTLREARMQCDRCSSRAYVFVTLDTGGKLAFCGHDYAVNEEALFAYAVEVMDERHLLEA